MRIVMGNSIGGARAKTISGGVNSDELIQTPRALARSVPVISREPSHDYYADKHKSAGTAARQ